MWADQHHFFDEGLCFECQQCGACCTGAPGTIYVSGEEIDAIAQYLEITVAAALADFLYPYKNSFSIREDAAGNCFFYKGGCTIYTVRPLQCRSFPFWFENVRTRANWQAMSRQCPGIGRGRRYTREEIMALARKTTMI